MLVLRECTTVITHKKSSVDRAGKRIYGGEKKRIEKQKLVKGIKKAHSILKKGYNRSKER